MKTQKCLQARGRAPHRGHQVIHGDLTLTYCPGEPKLIERVYKALGQPYKFSMLMPDEVVLADMLDRRLANMKKQLRTRDRKITKLMKENKALRAEILIRREGGNDLDVGYALLDQFPGQPS